MTGTMYWFATLGSAGCSVYTKDGMNFYAREDNIAKLFGDIRDAPSQGKAFNQGGPSLHIKFWIKSTNTVTDWNAADPAVNGPTRIDGVINMPAADLSFNFTT